MEVDISGNLVCGGTGTFTGDLIAFSSSDRNLKENITVIPNALDKVNSLSGNTFTWKSGSYNESLNDDTGVIAQVPVLIQAIKELEARVKTLEG